MGESGSEVFVKSIYENTKRKEGERKMKCEECKYWKQRFSDSKIYGWCCRYPNKIEKYNDDFCGEFKVK
jgi:hypothetical protein